MDLHIIGMLISATSTFTRDVERGFGPSASADRLNFLLYIEKTDCQLQSDLSFVWKDWFVQSANNGAIKNGKNVCNTVGSQVPFPDSRAPVNYPPPPPLVDTGPWRTIKSEVSLTFLNILWNHVLFLYGGSVFCHHFKMLKEKIGIYITDDVRK
jgi:hypothetical protein